MLLDKYKLNYDNNNLEYFTSIINDHYFTGSWEIPKNIEVDRNLINIDNKTYNSK